MMTDAVTETIILGRIPDSNDNLYRLKDVGKTRKIST